MAPGDRARRVVGPVEHDDDLRPGVLRLRPDRPQRDVEVARAPVRGDDDGGGRGHAQDREASLAAPVILVLHNRYRVSGGGERVVADLAWLAREHLGEDVEFLERESADLPRARAAAGLLAGGLDPAAVRAGRRPTRAR